MKRRTAKTVVLEIVLYLTAVLFIFPLYILVNLAVRTQDAQASPVTPTLRPTGANFVAAWQQAHLGNALGNSAFVTVMSVVVIIVVSSLAAYPLARVTSRLSTTVFWFLLAGMLVPFQVAMIPLYQTIRDLGLLGNVWSLVIFYSGLQIPFSMFLYTGFLRAMPLEFEEAAAIDGAGRLRIFWSVVFPLMRPITGTVVILNVITVWNDFLTPLLYLSGTTQQTVTVALYSFVGQFVSNWPVVFAGLVISIAPVLIVYFLLQRHIIQGFAGGLKG